MKSTLESVLYYPSTVLHCVSIAYASAVGVHFVHVHFKCVGVWGHLCSSSSPLLSYYPHLMSKSLIFTPPSPTCHPRSLLDKLPHHCPPSPTQPRFSSEKKKNIPLSGYPTGRVSPRGEMGPRCLLLCRYKLLGRDGALEGWVGVGEKKKGAGQSVLCAHVNSSIPGGWRNSKGEGEEGFNDCWACADFQTVHVWLVTLQWFYQLSTSLKLQTFVMWWKLNWLLSEF